ncbi:hypothetical protein KIN20_035787 [Parelaphostrongylus tenuis]|uniref:Uncharacterized protein n=1 Tax=Parelaphostrongylus tenuis TaxID=148309 RepID=A0AAD5WK82_PARTN|nr:hypothetical protein KIN20_035787 [Parelaphostrongylus tenuis]
MGKPQKLGLQTRQEESQDPTTAYTTEASPTTTEICAQLADSTPTARREDEEAEKMNEMNYSVFTSSKPPESSWE